MMGTCYGPREVESCGGKSLQPGSCQMSTACSPVSFFRSPAWPLSKYSATSPTSTAPGGFAGETHLPVNTPPAREDLPRPGSQELPSRDPFARHQQLFKSLQPPSHKDLFALQQLIGSDGCAGTHNALTGDHLRMDQQESDSQQRKLLHDGQLCDPLKALEDLKTMNNHQRSSDMEVIAISQLPENRDSYLFASDPAVPPPLSLQLFADDAGGNETVASDTVDSREHSSQQEPPECSPAKIVQESLNALLLRNETELYADVADGRKRDGCCLHETSCSKIGSSAPSNVSVESRGDRLPPSDGSGFPALCPLEPLPISRQDLPTHGQPYDLEAAISLPQTHSSATVYIHPSATMKPGNLSSVHATEYPVSRGAGMYGSLEEPVTALAVPAPPPMSHMPTGQKQECIKLGEYDMCEVCVCWHLPRLPASPERPADTVPIRRVLGIHAGITLFNLHRIICISLGLADDAESATYNHVWVLPNNNTYGGGPLTRTRSAASTRLKISTDRSVEFRHSVRVFVNEFSQVLPSPESVLLYVFGCVQLHVQLTGVLRDKTKQNALVWVPRCISSGSYGSGPSPGIDWNSVTEVSAHVPVFTVDVQSINKEKMERALRQVYLLQVQNYPLHLIDRPEHGMDMRILKCFGEPILQFWQDPERVRDLSICMQRQCSGRVERRAVGVKQKRKTRKKMSSADEADAEAEDENTRCSSSPSSALSFVAARRGSRMRRRKGAAAAVDAAAVDAAAAEAAETAESSDVGPLNTFASHTLTHAASSNATTTSSCGAAGSIYTDTAIDCADRIGGVLQTFPPELATSAAATGACGSSRFLSSVWSDGLASLTAWGRVADAAAGGVQRFVTVPNVQSFTFAKPLEHEFFAFSASPFSVDTARALTLPLTSDAAHGFDNDTEFTSFPHKIKAAAAENMTVPLPATQPDADAAALPSFEMLPAAASASTFTQPSQCASICSVVDPAVADSAAAWRPPVVASCAADAASVVSYTSPFECVTASAGAAESIGASHGLRNWTHAVGRVSQPEIHAAAVKTHSSSSTAFPLSSPHLSSLFSSSSSSVLDTSCPTMTPSAFAFPSAVSVHEASFGAGAASFASRCVSSAAAWDDFKTGSAAKTGDARHGVRGRKRRRKHDEEMQSSLRRVDEETACCSTAVLKGGAQQAMQTLVELRSTRPTGDAQDSPATTATHTTAGQHMFLLNPDMGEVHADTHSSRGSLQVAAEIALYKATNNKSPSQQRCTLDGYGTTKQHACSRSSSSVLETGLCATETAAENTSVPLNRATMDADAQGVFVKQEALEAHQEEDSVRKTLDAAKSANL